MGLNCCVTLEFEFFEVPLSQTDFRKMTQTPRVASAMGHDLPGKRFSNTHSFLGPIISYQVERMEGLLIVEPNRCADGNSLEVTVSVGGSTGQHPPETPWFYAVSVLVEEPEPGEWIARFFENGNRTGESIDITAVGSTGGLKSLTLLDNELSSCLVKPGYKAIAYNGPDYSGRKMIFSKDPYPGRANYKITRDGYMAFTYFPDKINDSISSIRCERDP